MESQICILDQKTIWRINSTRATYANNSTENVPCLPRKKVVFGCQLCNSTLSFLAVKFVDGINFYVSPLIPAKLAGSYDVPKVFELFRDSIYL